MKMMSIYLSNLFGDLAINFNMLLVISKRGFMILSFDTITKY